MSAFALEILKAVMICVLREAEPGSGSRSGQQVRLPLIFTSICQIALMMTCGDPFQQRT